MWSKDELKRVVERRTSGRVAAGPKFEEAALLYARWKGMTDEADANKEEAKKQLDALIDGMEPDDWNNLERIVPKLGDEVFYGLLTYGVERCAEHVKAEAEDTKRVMGEVEDDDDRR
jgi:hypothetical protein